MLKSLLTRQHSQVPAEEGGERLEGNTNNGRVQGFSQTIKKQEKKSDLGKKSLYKQPLSITVEFGIWTQKLYKHSQLFKKKEEKVSK